jgi:hypothetical protein
MSSSREEFIQLAEAFTNETDSAKLVQLAQQLLDALNHVEPQQNESANIA